MSQNREGSEAQAEVVRSESSSDAKHNVNDLRRVRDHVPWRLWAVAAIGFWERAAFWGLLAPWRKYTTLDISSDEVHR
jgi:POT family proton-dependent oligopeptide transporter